MCYYTTRQNKQEIMSFRLNAAYCFASRHTKHIKISPGYELFFDVKTINCMTYRKAVGKVRYDTYGHDVYQVCHRVKNVSCSSPSLE